MLGWVIKLFLKMNCDSFHDKLCGSTSLPKFFTVISANGDGVMKNRLNKLNCYILFDVDLDI